MKKKINIENYENACKEMAEIFIKKYFGRIEDCDYWFVADDPSGVLYVNDYWFNISDIYSFLREKYSIKDMFAYYSYSLEFTEKECNKNPKLNDKRSPINITHWRKLK